MFPELSPGGNSECGAVWVPRFSVCLMQDPQLPPSFVTDRTSLQPSGVYLLPSPVHRSQVFNSGRRWQVTFRAGTPESRVAALPAQEVLAIEKFSRDFKDALICIS